MFSFLSSLSSARAQRRRLEAFFSVLPLEYCGWSQNAGLVYSRGFTRLLGISKLNSIHDIENAIIPSDAAALEGAFLALNKAGEAFSLTIHTLEAERILRISGARGGDLGGTEMYDIIWLQDITDTALETNDLKADLAGALANADKLQSTLDAFPMPVWFADALNDIAWVNTAYARVLNKDPLDIITGKVFLPLTLANVADDAKARISALIRAARTEQKPQTLRGRLIVDGHRRMAELTFLPLQNSDLVVVQAADVTAEEDNAAAHKRYVAAQGKLLEQLQTAVAIFAADHKLEFHNSAFSHLWGVEDAWLNEHPKLGDFMEKLRTLRRLPEQADFRAFKKSWLDMFTGLLAPTEDMLYLPDGQAVRMLVAPHPMGGLMMTFEDVTSRLALETSYNTLMAVQRETLENLAEGVAVFGPDGRLKLSNPRFMELWALNPEDLSGEPHVTQIVERLRHFFKLGWQDVEEILTAMALDRREQTHQLGRDDDTVLECAARTMPDGGMMITYRDVTDKIRAEDALRDKASALEEAEKLKTDFLANVSYQLRTPLNAMTGFAEILENRFFGDLNDKQDEYVKGILEAGTRLVSLIDDILDLSTIEAGYMYLRDEQVDLSKMLHDVFELTREWAGLAKIQATLDCPDNLGIMQGDHRRLKQILINLIRNSINFTPEGGKITLAASADDTHVKLIVSDTGIGIREEDTSHLFQPFQRSATTTASGKAAGSGLGLSLVRNIARLHGGEVDLQSKKGIGTTITVTLPRQRSAL